MESVMYKDYMPNHKALDELRSLFLKNYGLKLTDEELEQEASDLLYIYAFSQGRLDELPPLQEFEDD
jgi:hypothetical protein